LNIFISYFNVLRTIDISDDIYIDVGASLPLSIYDDYVGGLFAQHAQLSGGL
jgi:hypothetical protein